MCGFVGFFGGGSYGGLGDEYILKRMADAISYRGPDDAGYWCDGDHRIGLGHRRLSIVDLSHAGHQPMQSVSGRYMIAFNGEIYNHTLLRQTLEGAGQTPIWRGHSDTETLLAGFDAWGIQGTVARTIGMFAFAVWDRQTSSLTLGRDRLGEKPLYYGWQGGVFLFGSELKALKAHPAFQGAIDRNALTLLMRHNAIPAPHSIYQGISKLLPASLLTVSMRETHASPKPYWDACSVITEGLARPFQGSPDDAVNELERLLQDAVGQQMTADVPLGAFLSGGIDSSTVVALMQAQSMRPVKTFAIGFHEPGYNEAEHAKAVAKHLGTEHTEMYVTSQQALAVVPHLPVLYDEPFADSSQIPTFLVSQLARQQVTVSLSGDAGDELFCGYPRYQTTASLWRKLALVPMPLRHLAASGLTGISPQSWNALLGSFAQILPASLRNSNIGDRLHKGACVISSRSVEALYLGLISHWRDPEALVLGAKEPATFLNGKALRLDGLNGVEHLMALDLMTYLPDDILTKVDRAAMGVSLETRIPFLDHRVIEFAWHLPQTMKLNGNQTKWVLRQVLYRYVPKALIERPKMGFGVPIDTWLRGPLREWAEELLDESRLVREGIFNATPIREKWAEHLSGKRNWHYLLWNVLMFQAWFEINGV